MGSDHRSLWETAGGIVPLHWEFKTIEQLLEHPKSITVGVMYPGNHSVNGIPLIKVSDVKNGVCCGIIKKLRNSFTFNSFIILLHTTCFFYWDRNIFGKLHFFTDAWGRK